MIRCKKMDALDQCTIIPAHIRIFLSYAFLFPLLKVLHQYYSCVLTMLLILMQLLYTPRYLNSKIKAILKTRHSQVRQQTVMTRDILSFDSKIIQNYG